MIGIEQGHEHADELPVRPAHRHRDAGERVALARRRAQLGDLGRAGADDELSAGVTERAADLGRRARRLGPGVLAGEVRDGDDDEATEAEAKVGETFPLLVGYRLARL